MFRLLMCLVVGLCLLAGCSPNVEVAPVEFGQSKGIVSGANLRLVTERPTRKGLPPVVCTEPSPDYAVAFNNNRQVTAVTPSQAGERRLEVNLSSTEELKEGQGRAQAVLALRDGLYTACQSYASGLIGQDAYAIILSQYGNLLVALVGNNEAAKNIQVSGPQAAISAMTVACISGQDSSRLIDGHNGLLTPDFCRKVLDGVLKKAAAQTTSSTTTAPGGKKKEQENGGGQQKPENEANNTAAAAASTSNITTKTTTETTIKQK